jgi:hypothetical protein
MDEEFPSDTPEGQVKITELFLFLSYFFLQKLSNKIKKSIDRDGYRNIK